MTEKKINLMNKTICLQCNNEMIIKLSNLSQNKIILYCEKCFFYNEYLINNDLLDKSLGQNNNLSKNIICKKCNKSYCSKCYLLHKDIITNVKLKPKENLVKKNIFLLQHIQMKQ